MLYTKIQEDLKAALKEGETEKVSTLRFLLSAIKNKEIALRLPSVAQDQLTDEEVVAVIQKQARERRESIEAYSKANRDDLKQKEEAELAILQSYLPEQMSQAELEKIISETIGELGAGSLSDFGRVMSAVMAKVKGKADGNLVSASVREKLSGNDQ